MSGRMSVPVWVAAGGRLKVHAGDIVDLQPRCSFRPRVASAPAGRSYNNMFRNRIRDDVSRCHVPRQEVLMDAEVDVGLVAMEAFLVSLRKEVAIILRSVGGNDSMAGI